MPGGENAGGGRGLKGVGGGFAIGSGDQVGIDDPEITLQNFGIGMAHQAHQGDQVIAVAQTFDSVGTAEVVDLRRRDSGSS